MWDGGIQFRLGNSIEREQCTTQGGGLFHHYTHNTAVLLYGTQKEVNGMFEQKKYYKVDNIQHSKRKQTVLIFPLRP